MRLVPAAVLGGSVLAEDVPEPAAVTPGMAGFVVAFLMALALIVLIRSMSKHLRRVEARTAEDKARAEIAAGAGDAAEGADGQDGAGDEASAEGGASAAEGNVPDAEGR